MADSEGAAIARLQEQVKGVREDLAELVQESQRTRRRLHDLEGTAGMLVDQEKIRRDMTAKRQRSVEIRLQVLTAVVAVAAFAEPFLYHLANGG